MYQFMEQNSLYVVLAIVLVIWGGLAVLLFSLDSKIGKTERRVAELEEFSNKLSEKNGN